jgi:hypothetical protein
MVTRTRGVVGENGILEYIFDSLRVTHHVEPALQVCGAGAKDTADRTRFTEPADWSGSERSERS